MHGALWLLPGVADFEHLEELLNDMSPIQVNAPLALTVCAVKSQVDVLNRLVAEQMLVPTMLVRKIDIEQYMQTMGIAANQVEGGKAHFLQRMEYLEAGAAINVIVNAISTGQAPLATCQALVALTANATEKSTDRIFQWFNPPEKTTQ